MGLAELSTDLLHEAAIYSTAAQIVVRTGQRARVEDHGRRYRIHAGGHIVQTFSRRSGDWQIADVDRPLAVGTDVVIFVDFSTPEPEYYVVPGPWFEADVARRHQAFIDRVGARPRNPSSKHHAVRTSDVSEWHNCWTDVLGGRL